MKVKFRKYECVTKWLHYEATGENALLLVSEEGEPIATASVCLYPPNPHSKAGEVWLKGWSENEGLPEALAAAGVVELTDTLGTAGHCVAVLAKLTPASMAELEAFYASDPNATAARQESLARAASR